MANTAKLNDDFSISLPEDFRVKTNWQSGQEFALIPSGKHFVLMPVPKLEELFGIARGANTDDIRDRRDRY